MADRQNEGNVDRTWLMVRALDVWRQ